MCNRVRHHLEITVFASIWNTFPSGLFTSLSSAANTVMELFGLGTKWCHEGDPTLLNCFLLTLVKMLSAAGARGGCQAGWTNWVCPQPAFQSSSRKDWSPNTSPCMVGSRKRHEVSSLCSGVCSYSNTRVNFICTQSQHAGGWKEGGWTLPEVISSLQGTLQGF